MKRFKIMKEEVARAHAGNNDLIDRARNARSWDVLTWIAPSKHSPRYPNGVDLNVACANRCLPDEV